MPCAPTRRFCEGASPAFRRGVEGWGHAASSLGVPFTTMIKITSLILKLQIQLLCEQLTYFSSKEHMSNSTKGITIAIVFLITCPLDHP